MSKWICDVCDYQYEGIMPPSVCPVCRASMFIEDNTKDTIVEKPSKTKAETSKIIQTDLTPEQSFNQFEYVKTIFYCEKQKYILEQRNKTLVKKDNQGLYIPPFEKTQFYQNYRKEYIPYQKQPDKVKKADGFDAMSWLGYMLLLGVIGAVAGFVLSIVVTFWHYLFGSGFSEGFHWIWSPFFTLLIIGAVLGIIVGVYRYFSVDSKYQNNTNNINQVKKQNEDTAIKNEAKLNHWKKEYQKYYDKKVDDFKKGQHIIIQNELNVVKNQYRDVSATLEMLYHLRINGILCLHPNYQGLLPISIIYGYFETGKCSQLQGHEGAYILYDDERIKNIIIDKLDFVSQQLNQLQGSMYYIGQALEECSSQLSSLEATSRQTLNSINTSNHNLQKQLGGMQNTLNSIDNNTANAAYYSKIGADMATFNAFYNYYRDKNIYKNS